MPKVVNQSAKFRVVFQFLARKLGQAIHGRRWKLQARGHGIEKTPV
jgi:hypothetical protein